MLETADDLKRAIRGTMLEGREVALLSAPSQAGSKRPIPESPQAWAVRIDAHDVDEGWRAARSLVVTTGCWPVAAASWGAGLGNEETLATVGQQLSRFEYVQEDAGAVDPASIIERSRGVDLDAALGTAAAYRRVPPVGEEVASSVHADVLRSLSESFRYADLLTAIVFVPDPVPEHVLAYLHWFAGSSTVPTHVLIALMRRWRERFGVELVAHWGTMLELLVQRRPTAVAEALRVAWEVAVVAECTTIDPGISRSEHAAAVLQIDRWSLHERP